MFHCVNVSQLSYPFIWWWTSRLLPYPNYCKQCCDEFFSPLPFTSFLFSAICKVSWDNHFAFLHFFFLEMVLIPASYIQPWRTSFPILNQSIVPCHILTLGSWLENRFLKKQVRWSSILISLRFIHSLLWSTQLKALA